MSSCGQFSKSWEDLEFSDNYIFCKVMENTELCKELLEILLHIKIHHLEKPISERTIQPGYNVKGVRMDVYVQDSNKVFDIEMQTGNYEDLLLRARYYQVGMDLGETPRRTKYKDLKETYIIFICKDDPFNMSCPVYTKKSIFEECPEFNYQDKTHFVVYNSSAYEKEKDKEVKSVLKFIYGLKAETSFTNKLETTVNEMKQEQSLKEGYMDFLDYVEEEKDEAVLQNSMKTAKNMLEDGVPIEKIAKYTNLKIEDIEALTKELTEKVGQ